MKKSVLLVTLLALTPIFYATASFSERPGNIPVPGNNIPDVTGVYEGTNRRFLPETPGTTTINNARFYIWGQSERLFWGSVMSDDGGGWLPRGYINGVIQPDNTVYFVNHLATYDGDGTFSNISPITVMTNAIFIPASGQNPKRLETVGLRFGNPPFQGTAGQTTSGTYIHTTTYPADENPGSPYAAAE